MNLLEISKFLSLASGITTIGLLLAIAFFLNDVEGKLWRIFSEQIYLGL